MAEVGPDFWAKADQIDASLRDTKVILERRKGEPSPIAEAFRKLRADVTALEERVTKLESEAVRHGAEVEALATTREVAKFLRLTENTVKTWRTRAQGPPWFTFEGTVRYRWADIEAWLSEANNGWL